MVDLGERDVNDYSFSEYLGDGGYFRGCRWSRCWSRRGRGGSAIGTACRGAHYPRPENIRRGATAGSRPITEDDGEADDVEGSERWRRLVRQLQSGEGGRGCAAVPRAARLLQQTGRGRRRRRLRALAALARGYRR